MAEKKKRNVPAHFSIGAGAIAGGVEAVITYPTEFVKTQLQLQSKKTLNELNSQIKFSGPIDVLRQTIKDKGFFAIYKGVDAVCIGAAVKAGVRFLSFEQLKIALADKDGKLSSGRRVLAGLGAGVLEAMIAVTPSETIKTKLIHDQNSPNPKYKGLIHGTKSIIKSEGIRGIYRGMTAVVLRQGANSAVRLTTFDFLKENSTRFYLKKDNNGPVILPWYVNFMNGALAGIVTVYSTMPLDVVKTKMQSLDGAKRYKNSLDCLYRTARDDGIKALWKGTTPRLGRLIFSGGIIFTVYESMLNVFEDLTKK
ncbi:hypothetical protein HK098_005993 [Nowakowskiella sp. JEL0407]|nr:hypothetical protein HK098_005993 [Nowakowskiella sp. JEL0407]